MRIELFRKMFGKTIEILKKRKKRQDNSSVCFFSKYLKNGKNYFDKNNPSNITLSKNPYIHKKIHDFKQNFIEFCEILLKYSYWFLKFSPKLTILLQTISQTF